MGSREMDLRCCSSRSLLCNIDFYFAFTYFTGHGARMYTLQGTNQRGRWSFRDGGRLLRDDA
jgi:hypothetical protein